MAKIEESKKALSGDVRTEPIGCWERFYPSGFIPELKELLKFTVPIVLSQILKFLIAPVALMFCGHLGEIELAAVALASSFINITAFTVALGLACACDTLFAQVYGSRNRHRMGIELQKSLLILLLAVFPCWAVHLNIEALLRLLGQDPLVARKAAEYLLIFMPGVLFIFIHVALFKYIQNQNAVVPDLIIGAIANGVNALLHYLLVSVAELGINGSAIAQAVSYFTMMLLTFLYILKLNKTKETWRGWSVDCLRDWGQFLRLGAFGLVMLCVEFWSFEIGIITAGLLSTTHLGAMAVIFQLETFAYQLPTGVGIAANIRVGQFLGAGDAKGAQTTARVTLTSICLAEVFMSIMFLALRNYLPLLFTKEPDVINMVRDMLFVVAVHQISDGLAATGSGILRGQGKQNLGAAIVFGGFTLALATGIPLMLFTSLKLFAFWGALVIVMATEGIVFAIIIHKNDWQKLAKQAQIRTKVQPESEPLHALAEGTDTISVAHRKCPEQPVPSSKRGENFDYDEVTETKTSPMSFIIHRVLALVVVVSIFIGGVLLRIFYTNHLQIPSAPQAGSNGTTSAWGPTASLGYTRAEGAEVYTGTPILGPQGSWSTLNMTDIF